MKRIFLTLFAILVIAVLVYYAIQILRRSPATTAFQHVAHRGGGDQAPENTLAAFQNAIDLGVDGLEFDVQMTQDGALVVIHDETVDRTTNGSGAVRDLSLEQIRSLDAGNGEQVPTVEGVIALAREAGIDIYPETKSAHLYPGIEAKLLQTLAAADYLDQTVIQSFRPESLLTLRDLDPEANLCALYGLWQFDPTSPAADASSVCLMAEMVLLNPEMIRKAHDDGRQALVWFGIVEHPITVNLMRFLGADGVMVDNPQTFY